MSFHIRDSCKVFHQYEFSCAASSDLVQKMIWSMPNTCEVFGLSDELSYEDSVGLIWEMTYHILNI